MIASLMDVRGVRYAALVDTTGQAVMQVGAQPDLSVAVSGRAMIGSLKNAMGAADWKDLLLDLEGGPVLLTPLGDQVLLTAFDDVASLGRVRFAVRRSLGRV